MNSIIFADLHNHTTASDGDFTPTKLVELAKKKGVYAIGITDHDTLSGLKEGLLAGEKYKTTVVPGVELSVRFKRPYFTGTLHLLCYFKSALLEDDSFVKEFNHVLAQGRGEKLVRARVDEINKFFGPDTDSQLLNRELRFEDISALSSNATRRHFALALQQEFNITNKETINQIIGNNSPAYLPSGIELSMITEFVKKYPMVVSLAHPAAGSFPGEGHYKEVLPPVETVEKILPEFIEIGMNAIEVFYPGHTPEHQELMKTWAEKYNFTMTGGSDCHDEKERPFGVQGLTESQFNTFVKSLG